MAEEKDDGHAGEVRAHPTKEQVGPYVLDQAPSRDELLVEPIRPEASEPAGEYGPCRPDVLLAPVVGSQVLLSSEILADTNLAGVEGLEDEAVRVAVVDHPRYPRRPATPAPGQEDRAPVITKVHMEPAEQPGEGRAPLLLRCSCLCHADCRYDCGRSPGGFPSSVSGATQSSLQANFAVMPARRKKNSVEPGMYQCHSRKEDTRYTTSADVRPASRSRRSPRDRQVALAE